MYYDSLVQVANSSILAILPDKFTFNHVVENLPVDVTKIVAFTSIFSQYGETTDPQVFQIVFNNE
jgi:hypothetical protein